MIETIQSRKAFERATGRKLSVAQQEKTAVKPVAQQSRAEYFRDYRKRPKVCPNCGHDLSKKPLDIPSIPVETPA